MGKMPSAVMSIETGDRLEPEIGRRERARRRDDIDQINAISAFEGSYSTPEFSALQEKYVSGEMSLQQLQKAVIARWKRNG